MNLKNLVILSLLFLLFNCGDDDPVKFVITFDSQGGTAVDPVTITTPSTTIGNLPASPTKTGFTFAGWFTEQDGKGAQFTANSLVTADMTVYAFWQHVPFTVTFDSRGGTAVSPIVVPGSANTVGTLPPPPTKNGAAFGGWSMTASGNTPFTATTLVTGDLTVYAIWDWIAGTLPASAEWQSVAYGNGVFVAVAYGSNQAATSEDGITWTSRTLPNNANWISITYGNGIFVVITAHDSQLTATSPDGINWTSGTLPGNAFWTSVTYGNGIFVATTNSTNVATSTDGIAWTMQSPPGSFRNWHAITYGKNVFVAVAYAENIAITSSEGITWTERTLPCDTDGGDSGWNSVVYGNDVFVAVSTGGCSYGAISPDGVSWTEQSFPDFTYWSQVAYGNGTFVAIASASDKVVMSPNGTDWNYGNLPYSSTWSSIAYGNGIFVIVSKGNNQAATLSWP